MKVEITNDPPKIEEIEPPPVGLAGPDLLLQWLQANPEFNDRFEFNDVSVSASDLVEEIIELREYNERACKLVQRMGDLNKFNMEVDSSGVNIEIRSKLTILLAEYLGSYLRDARAKNFVTMSLTSPDPEVGGFEVTVRRLSGETPAEQLFRIKAENEKLRDILELNGIPSSEIDQ